MPPLGAAVKVMAVPTVPVEGPLMETASGNAAMVIDAVAFATTAFVSVTLTDTV